MQFKCNDFTNHGIHYNRHKKKQILLFELLI